MKKTLAIGLLVGATLLTGCGSSENFVVTNNNGVIPAPICVDDAYSTNANATLTVNAANGVLANDTPNGATLTFQGTSANGGTITGAQDGSFTYVPPASFTGSDTFTYTLGNSGGVVTCTVTITVNAVNGFFVDAANGNDTTGSFTGGLPYASIQAAVTAAGTNQDIVVLPGTYTGNVTLLNGQRLLGSGSSLITPQGAVRPVLNGAGITLADGNTIDFIRIQGTPGDAIFGNGVNGATISNCEIANLTNNAAGIRDDRGTGNWAISNNTITSIDGIGIVFSGSTGDALVARITGNTITATRSGAIGITYIQAGTVRAQVVNNGMTGATIPGRTFCADAANTADICLDITGNTNDDAYELSQRDTATTRVEQLSQLTALNSGGAVVTTPGGSNPPTEVPDGTCGF